MNILEQNEKIELMYRPPGRESHINITEALDEIFHRLDSMSSHSKSYPPYNLIKHDNANYEIEMALAGFKPEEIAFGIV